MYDPGIYGEQGIPSSFNHPGARFGAVGWYDSVRQEYWLFGGRGSPSNGFGMFLISIHPTTTKSQHRNL